MPHMVYIHGIEVWENTRPRCIRCARRADFLVANSAYTRDRADRIHGGFSQARVCWLATETDDEPPAARRSGPPTALIVGRIDEDSYKGHIPLIDCWPTVRSAVPDARLVIVGQGPGLRPIQQRAQASACREAIELRGFVPDAELEELWSSAHLYAMPSRGEGFGLVYIEAMRQGLPVVASVHDAASEINLDGVTGYNVDLDRPDQLPDRLIHLLRNPDHADALGASGRKRWRDHFCFSAFRSRFRPLLHEFLELR